MTRRVLALALAVAGMLACVESASAALYCVNKPPCTGGTPHADLKAAVDAANGHSGADRIEIGEGTYPFVAEADAMGGAGAGLEVVGAGRGETILEGGGAGTRVLHANSVNTLVSDLTITLAAANSSGALYLRGGRVERVDVDGVGGTSTVGIYLIEGADAEDVRVLLPTTPIPTNYGFSVHTGTVGPSELVRVEARARYATTAGGDFPVTIRGGRFTGRTAGLLADDGGTIDADGVLVEIAPDSSGNAVLAHGHSGTDDSVVDLRHATIVGGGSGNQHAFDLSQSAGNESRIVARDVVVSGIPKDARLSTSGSVAGTMTKLDIAYSTALRGPPTTTGAVGTHSVLVGEGMIPPPADPGFVGGGDFALRSSSPYVDTGEPGGLGAGQSPVDLLGAPRITDGNGDGTARRDVGAFEYQPPPPPAAAAPISSTPPVASVPPLPVGLPRVVPRRAPLLRLLFASAVRLDRRGRLILPVSCPRGGPACAGRVQVATASAIAAQRRRRRVVSFGTASYRVAAGRTARLVIRVSARNRSLLRRRRSIRLVARATATDGGAARKAFTLRPAKRPRRR
jgi:hypothetical protein